MDNILVFKTCSDNSMDSLFRELADCGSQVVCVLPHSCVERYKSRYKDVRFIDSGMEIFEFQKFDFHILRGIQIGEIYVPSDSPYFRNYENVFFIIDRLKYKQMVLYDCYGSRRCYPYKNRVHKYAEYLLSSTFFHLYTVIYKIKCLWSNE